MQSQNTQQKEKRIIPVWQDLAEDFLELKYMLSESQRRFVLETLEKEKISKELVLIHECFSIDGYLILIAPKKAFKQIWLYDLKSSEIRRIPTTI